MGTVSFISGIALMVFLFSTINVIGGQSNIDCSALNQTECCKNEECYFAHCTNKTEPKQNLTQCVAKSDTTTFNDKCANGTTKHICDGPTVIGNVCSNLNTSESCCNTTDALEDCGWVSCKDAAGKNHTGCHNMTDIADITKSCPDKKYEDTCKKPELTCGGLNDTECCLNKDIGCILVNCTGKDSKSFKGCYNSSEVTCEQKVDICAGSTTPSPITTTPKAVTTPRPPYLKVCETYNDTTSCCSQDTFSCIFVANCSDAKLKGCYSHHNATDIKTKCGPVYLDSCVTTTPVPPTTTTAAPSSGENTGRHFDGASFIGGIVLCAGIILIIFFALKWYKSRRNSNNYHQM